MVILLDESCCRKYWGEMTSAQSVSWQTVMKALIALFPQMEKDIQGHMNQGGVISHLTMPVPEHIPVSAVKRIKGLFLLQPANVSEARRMKEALVA